MSFAKARSTQAPAYIRLAPAFEHANARNIERERAGHLLLVGPLEKSAGEGCKRSSIAYVVICEDGIYRVVVFVHGASAGE